MLPYWSRRDWRAPREEDSSVGRQLGYLEVEEPGAIEEYGATDVVDVIMTSLRGFAAT